MSAPVGPLLVFDFDHTITDLNTDVEVQKLAPRERFQPQVRSEVYIQTRDGRTTWAQFSGFCMRTTFLR